MARFGILPRKSGRFPVLSFSEPVPRQMFVVHELLSTQSRLPLTRGERVSLIESLGLVGCGALAAVLVIAFDVSLRIPGHAILRAVPPIALGLALVPRQFAGTVMSLSALATCGILYRGGFEPVGAGAMTSLLTIGPCLDVTFSLATSRHVTAWAVKLPVLISCAMAGMASNLLAFLVRGALKSSGALKPLERALADWWSTAIFTYLACGCVAGLVSGLLWFHLRPRPPVDSQSNGATTQPGSP